MRKFIFISALALSSLPAWSQIREFQTTRLNSTAGAGVASILSTEAAILNPASAAFFTEGSASYQSYKTTLSNKNDARNTIPDSFSKRNSSQALFVSDYSGPVKGGISYIKQTENNYERNRIIAHAAAAIGQTAAMGFSYNYIQDRLPVGKRANRYGLEHQLNFGITNIINEDLSIGFVMSDLTRATRGEEKATIGFQYQVTDKFTVIADTGAQYSKSFSKRNFWKAALQVAVFKDFFVRGGRFEDNIQNFRGYGWGAGWSGPRLGIEFGQKISEQFSNSTANYIYKGERLIDTSLSALIKF